MNGRNVKAAGKASGSIRKFFDLEAKTLNEDSSDEDEEGVEEDNYDTEDTFIDNSSTNEEEQSSAVALMPLDEHNIQSTSIKKVGAKPPVLGNSCKKRVNAKAPSVINLKLPGDSSYPVSSWSITVTKTKDDVSVHVLEIMFDFLKNHCLRGAVATEVGPRAHNFHVQGVMTLHYPTTPPFKKSLSKLCTTISFYALN